MHVEFEDGCLLKTEILFAADGSKSAVRSIVNPSSSLEYTGVTCVMGVAENKSEDRGILFPSSVPTINCRHGCFFPTAEGEQCFQMHYSVEESDADKGNWGTLSQKVGVAECLKLSEQMKDDGWDDKYIAPLREVTHAVRIGFCSLQPPLQKWVYGRIVLLGDAAHPRMYQECCAKCTSLVDSVSYSQQCIHSIQPYLIQDKVHNKVLRMPALLPCLLKNSAWIPTERSVWIISTRQ